MTFQPERANRAFLAPKRRGLVRPGVDANDLDVSPFRFYGHGPQPLMTASRSSMSTLIALVPLATMFAGHGAGGNGQGPHALITASRSSMFTTPALPPT